MSIFNNKTQPHNFITKNKLETMWPPPMKMEYSTMFRLLSNAEKASGRVDLATECDMLDTLSLSINRYIDKKRELLKSSK